MTNDRADDYESDSVNLDVISHFHASWPLGDSDAKPGESGDIGASVGLIYQFIGSIDAALDDEPSKRQ